MTARNLAVALLVSLLACAAWAQKDDSAAAQGREEIGAQIEELGTTLKAAAMSGVISGEEARKIYGRVVEAAKASYVRDFGDPGEKEGAAAGFDAKTNVARLRSPRPEQVQVLVQTEFLRRDLQLLKDALDLDRTQMVIAETLLEDYWEAFELAAAPLRETLTQYRGSTINSYIAFALDDAGVRLNAAVDNARRADRDEAMARMQETLSRIDEEKSESPEEDRKRYEAWKESMIAATSELDNRLVAIRERTTAQLNDMRRDDATITADHLLRMARQLRADRAQLRIDLTESIELIATKEQRGEENSLFDAVMARIRIRMLLPQGRFGGESMNLWAALTEVSRDLDAREECGDDGPLEYAEEWLDAWTPGIAARLDARTDATIDREIAGIEFRAVRDRIAAANGEPVFEIDERRLAAAIDPYVAALRREVAVSVAARDALLTLLNESTAALNEAYPESELASRLRDTSLRSGFPVETRRRWAERAMAAALELGDLEDEVFEALLLLDAEIASELEALRTTAIDQRIQRDPKLARDFIEAEFEDAEIEFDDNMWREVEYAAFAAIDERTETQLQAMLTPDQFESLLARPRGWDAWDKDPGKAKAAAGKSRAEGKAGKGTSSGKR